MHFPLSSNKFHLSNHSAINFLSASSEITELHHREYNKDTVGFLSSLFSHSVFVFLTLLASYSIYQGMIIKTKDISTEKFGRSIHCRGFSLSPRGGLTLLSVNLYSALATCTSLVCLITRQIVFFLVSFSYSQGQRVASITKRV